jgi:hypothetical protein
VNTLTGFTVGFLLPAGAALVILDCNPPTLTLLEPVDKGSRTTAGSGARSGTVLALEIAATCKICQ